MNEAVLKALIQAIAANPDLLTKLLGLLGTQPESPDSGFPDPDVDPSETGAPARGITEVGYFVHRGRVIGHADSDFWRMKDGIIPLNNQTKIALTPTWFDVGGHELKDQDWSARGWTENITLWGQVSPDPNNPQSVTTVQEQIAVTEIKPVELPADPIFVYGQRMIGRKGRSITVKVVKEGLWEFRFKMPDTSVTDVLRFTVR